MNINGYCLVCVGIYAYIPLFATKRGSYNTGTTVCLTLFTTHFSNILQDKKSKARHGNFSPPKYQGVAQNPAIIAFPVMALPTVLSTILLGIIAIHTVKLYLRFSRHLAEAKASGIPYVIVPFFHPNRTYQLFSIILLPVFRSLPEAWTNPWLDLIDDWFWKARYEQFQKIGADTFLTVAPERVTLNTADANVIAQITNRRDDFPKPVQLYALLRIYGDNVVVTEGQRWRHHRKITSPPFSEKNNHLVWRESLTQTQAMVRSSLASSKTSICSPEYLPKYALWDLILLSGLVDRILFGRVIPNVSKGRKANAVVMQGGKLA